MLKSISAALIAVAVLAAPAMAAGPRHAGKTVTTPAAHGQFHARSHLRDAHAKMVRHHHHRHVRHHHRFR